MGGWMAQCAELLDPLYQLMKKEVLSSKVIEHSITRLSELFPHNWQATAFPAQS